MARIKIDTEDLILALEDNNDELEWYLDKKTGEIFPKPDDPDLFEEDPLAEDFESDPDRFIYIEAIDSHESFEIMEDFVSSLSAGKAQEHLGAALSQSRPFRRFKDELDSFPGMKDSWFEFHDQQMKIIAQDWISTQNIEAELSTSAEK